MNDIDKNSIGVFDSGVGGLSVLRELIKALPSEKFIFIGDQYHVPYGERSMQEVRQFSHGIVRFLRDQGSKLIVVACNTASAAALHYLREEYPLLPIVGMEPAVKPAAEYSKTRKVGVLATPSTFQGELYASVVERFAQDVEIFQNTCPGLVNQIEKGALNSGTTRRILESALLPMISEGIDTVVLGCTHYPFVLPLIQEIVGEKIRVIDPAPAIANRVLSILGYKDEIESNPNLHNLTMYTTGDPHKLAKELPLLLNFNVNVGSLLWDQAEKYLSTGYNELN